MSGILMMEIKINVHISTKNYRNWIWCTFEGSDNWIKLSGVDVLSDTGMLQIKWPSLYNYTFAFLFKNNEIIMLYF